MEPDSLQMEFAGELYYWRGLSPYHFIRVPEDESLGLRDVVREGEGLVLGDTVAVELTVRS